MWICTRRMVSLLAALLRPIGHIDFTNGKLSRLKVKFHVSSINLKDMFKLAVWEMFINLFHWIAWRFRPFWFLSFCLFYHRLNEYLNVKLVLLLSEHLILKLSYQHWLYWLPFFFPAGINMDRFYCSLAESESRFRWFVLFDHFAFNWTF